MLLNAVFSFIIYQLQSVIASVLNIFIKLHICNLPKLFIFSLIFLEF